MRNLAPIKDGDFVRVIPGPEAKMLSYGKLVGYNEDYIIIEPLGTDENGDQISINGIDPGIDGITCFPASTAIVTLVNKEYLAPLDTNKLNQILSGQMKQ